MPMNRRERLTAIFAGQTPDRPAVKLWRAAPEQQLPHPDYEPVYRAAIERTGLMGGAGSPFDLYNGQFRDEHIHVHEQLTDSPEWVDIVTTLWTPSGELRRIDRRSTCNRPGYHMEFLLKEPADIKKLLSLPYAPYPFDAGPMVDMECRIGNAGITLFNLDHAMYGLQRLIGSQNFALWHISDPDLLLEAISIFAGRIRQHAEAAVKAGLTAYFGWVGPELCIPPLMSPADFDVYVSAFDKPLIDFIHNAGGRVWVHSHGKMGPVLERFIDMGADVLNPVEAPPMGDITLSEAFARTQGRMALEGNIQMHDMMTAEPDRLETLIHAAIDAGRGERFILCPTSSYMETPEPPPRLIENLLLYVNEGVRYAEEAH